MIRLILIFLFLFLFFIVGIPVCLVERIIGKFNRHARDISSLRYVQVGFKGVLFLAGTKTRVIGFENIPKDEPVLFVGNHRSYFDVCISYSIVPNLTGFVAKQNFEKDNIREGLKTILEGVELIKNGVSMTIFPEGTRNRTENNLLPFKEGSFKLAEKSGCKIIPMVQNNTEACWESHFPKIKRAHTIIEFCEPIDVKSLDKEQRRFLGEYVSRIINDTYEKNKALIDK